jgi:hypothetical protein
MAATSPGRFGYFGYQLSAQDPGGGDGSAEERPGHAERCNVFVPMVSQLWLLDGAKTPVRDAAAGSNQEWTREGEGRGPFPPAASRTERFRGVTLVAAPACVSPTGRDQRRYR